MSVTKLDGLSKVHELSYITSVQLVSNIRSCSKEAVDNFADFLMKNVKHAVLLEDFQPRGSVTNIEVSTLPKTVSIESKTVAHNLPETELSVVAEICNTLHVDPNSVLKFVKASKKLVQVNIEPSLPVNNGFQLIQSGISSYTESNKLDQLFNFYLSQYIAEQSSIYKLLACIIKELPFLLEPQSDDAVLLQSQVQNLKQVISEVDKAIPSMIEKSIKNLRFITETLKSLNEAPSPRSNLAAKQLSSFLLEVLNSVATFLVYSSSGFTIFSIVQWFQLMESIEYFSSIIHNEQLLLTIQSLSTIIALSFFDLNYNYGSLDDYSFMNSSKDLNAITKSILNTDSNPIILYAWSIILHRKETVLNMYSDDPRSEKFKNELINGPLEHMKDIYVSLAEEADKLNVSDALLQCNEALSYSAAFSNVLGIFSLTYIPYVQPNEKIIDTLSTILKSSSNKTVQTFFMSEAVEQLMILLKAKMPLSLDTFVSLVSINSNLAVEELRSLTSYMHIAENNSFNLKHAIDDQEPSLISLTSDYSVLPPYEPEGELCLLLHKGTKGQVLSSSNLKNETLVAFLYEYNGWTLLGRILKNLSINLNSHDYHKLSTISRLVNLLTSVVSDCKIATIKNVFKAMDEYLDAQDTIDVMFRILEQAFIFKDVSLIPTIFDFMTALVNNGYAYRVWSYIYKSNLFALKNNSGLIRDLLGKAEIPTGNFVSTIALFKLGSALLSNSLKIDDQVTIKLKSDVLSQIFLHAIQVFEHLATWKFNRENERFELGYLICDLFNTVLTVFNGIQEVEYKETKINEVLKISFDNIVNIFLIHDLEDKRSVSFIYQTLYEASTSYASIITNDLVGSWNQKLQFSVFELLSNLIKVRTSINPSSPSTLEKVLYSSTRGLVNIYLFDEALKKAVLKLLKDLISASWQGIPPSLLTHLGQTHTKLLLQALHNDMTSSATDDELMIALYDFFSSVMKNNQEGLSIVLITGKSNINGLETGAKTESNKLSLFEVLKATLQSYERYPAMVLLHILDSLSCLLTTWNGGLVKSEDVTFITKVLALAMNTKINMRTDNAIERIYRYKLKAKIVKILSLSLFNYHGKNKKCEDLIISNLNKKTFIDELSNVFNVLPYDNEFQSIVKTTFSSKWEGKYSLDQFTIRNIHRPNDFNVDLIYDFNLLDHIFEFDVEWPQLKRDIVKSGMDLLFTNVQIDLAKAYGGLITCFCNTNSVSVSPNYLKIANDLLKYTIDQNFNSEEFFTFSKDRVDLAFLICFNISKKQNFEADNQVLVSTITAASRFLQSDKVNLNEELSTLEDKYVETLFKVLIINLGMLNNSDLLVENSSTFIEIWKNVICKSMCVIFGSIRNNAIAIPNQEYGNNPLIIKQVEQIKLILQLVEKFISLDFTLAINKDLARITVESGAYNGIMSIYGVSHLIKVHQEDLFADYALLFILELIKNKSIAEKFISNGAFQLLNESTVSLMIQRGRITPYCSDSTVLKLHHIWVERILPIMLTLIGHFQDTIIFEVCRFTLAFQKQIEYTIHTWLETDTYISPIVIEETEQIILLAKLINALDCYNYISSETNKPVSQIRLIPGLDSIEERRMFVSALNYLLSHPKYLASKIRTLKKEISFDEISSSLVELKESLLQ